MYRADHFDACDFSFPHLGDTQSEIRKVNACPGADLRAVLMHLVQHDIEKGVVFVAAWNGHVEQAVDLMNLLCGAEDRLVGLVEGGEKEFSRGEQNSDGNNPQQTVQWRGVVDNDLARDGEQEHFEHRDRRVQIEHAYQLYSDDEVKACGEQVVIVRIGGDVR